MDEIINNVDDSSKKKKKIIVLAAVIFSVLVLLIIAYQAWRGRFVGNNSETLKSENNIQKTMPTEEGGIDLGSGDVNPNSAIPENARAEVAGANLIVDDVVITPSGQAVKNDVAPLSSEAPHETGPVSKEQLSSSVIKLDASSSGFSPNRFEVKAGTPVTVSVTSTDGFVHIFMFDSPALSAVTIGVGPNETRAITFNAPTEKGEYSFRCNVTRHADRGEIGVMVVN